MKKSYSDILRKASQLPAKFESISTETLKLARILCLTENPKSETMWGVYADSSKGMLLKLKADTDPEFDSISKTARPVTYWKTKPLLVSEKQFIENALGVKKHSYSEKRAKQIAFSKKDDWRYEREWRVVYFDVLNKLPEMFFHSFSPNEIVSVTLGAKIDDAGMDSVKK